MRRFLATTPMIDAREFGARGRDFIAHYQTRFNSAPSEAAHYVYDTVYLLAQAAAAQQSAILVD